MKIALEFFYRLFVGPRVLLFYALTILVGFGALHALGWREFTTVLSGTIPKGNTESEAAFKALAYMTAYFGTVLAAPIMLIAAALSFAVERMFRVSRGAL